MTKQSIQSDFEKLGRFLAQFGPEGSRDTQLPGNDLFYEPMQMLVERARESNPWFTEENVRQAFAYWADALQGDKIRKWLDAYDFPQNPSPKKVGIVMAGNIPLVGLHDLLSVLASGHKAVVKMSSSDNKFIPLLVKYLEHIHPEWKGRVEFRDGLMKDAEAFIATGSDNSARYFDYYFGKYPHIIRRNRNGVAVLTGNETDDELEKLAADIMLYYGLGCRNVSKIFVPRDFDLNRLFKALLRYGHYIDDKKYRNNYDYNKAVFIMSTDEAERQSLIDNGLVLLKRDHRYASPIGTVFYEYYDDLEDVKKILDHDKDKIQVIVSNANIPAAVAFGTTQQPELWDYADGIDTMRFLLDLHHHTQNE